MRPIAISRLSHMVGEYRLKPKDIWKLANLVL